MSYLVSQLWLCLGVALWLGGLIGWFLRGDPRKKLDVIEKRWRKRFTELELINQSLQGQQKNRTNLEAKHENVLSRLARMNKAAELSNQQLKLKNTALSKMEQKLEQASTELTDKDSRLDDLISKLSDVESQLAHAQQNSTESAEIANSADVDKEIEAQRKIEILKEQDGLKSAEIERLRSKLNNSKKQNKKIKAEHSQLLAKVDSYKASLIDTESKLQVTNDLLDAQKEQLDKAEQPLNRDIDDDQ